jgi:hypothetical protein
MIMKAPITLLTFIVLLYGGCKELDDGQAEIPPSHLAVVLDSSGSLSSETECDALAGLLQRGLQTSGISAGSKVLVMRTGTPDSEMEPEVLIYSDIPSSTRVLEGREAEAATRREFELSVLAACQKPHATAQESAIVLGVARALTQLHSLGCNSKVECHLYVRTDMEETIDSWFKDSIRRGKPSEKYEPPKLDNQGIAVTFCGAVERRQQATEGGKKKARRAEQGTDRVALLTALWAQVFTDPEAMTVEPVCPRAAAAGGAL